MLCSAVRWYCLLSNVLDMAVFDDDSMLPLAYSCDKSCCCVVILDDDNCGLERLCMKEGSRCFCF